MIILSGVLVVLAIALLVTGIVTGNTGHEVLGLDGLKLIYVSIGVSIISALCLAIGVFLRRKELFGSAESEASAKRSAASRSAKAARTAKTKARVGAGDDAPVVVTPAATATEVPAETSVYVVPGRKRYHLETCRQLAGREKEELTFVEAREEGFTACTACLPDTALAARAALTDTATVPTESLDSVSDTADLATAGTADVEDDPALVTRTDLPVTKIDTDTAPDLTDRELPSREPVEEDTGTVVEDTGTREAEPVAASPATGEVTEAPESEAPAADTAQLDEVSDAEAAPEPAAEERPLARSRSLFEPLERSETPTAEAEDEVEPDAVEHDEKDAETPVAAEAEPAEAESEDDAVAEADTTEAAEPAEVEDTEVEEAHADTDDAEDESEDTSTAEDAAPAEADGQVDPDLPYVRILSGTKRYHRPDCALIEDIAEDADDLETLSPGEAKERGCTPCLVCQPDKDSSDRY